jgi:hypothetical protein
MSVIFRETSITEINNQESQTAQLLATINAAPLPTITDATSLTQAQAYQKAFINQQCGQKIDGGFYSYAEGEKNADGTYKMLLYKSDANHREQLGLLYNLVQFHTQGLFTSLSCTWKDASLENEPCHAVTDACITQLFAEMGQHLLWCKLTSDALIEQIAAATTVDVFKAIVFTDEPAPTTPTATTKS